MTSWTGSPIMTVRAMPGIRVMVAIKPAYWRATALAFALMLMGVIFATVPDGPLRPGGDVWNYAAAGERLNAGHQLYALQTGDRLVAMKPPYWTVPLLSPPPVAVVWRPIAALGPPAWVVWWLAGAACSMAIVVAVIAKGHPAAIAGLFLLGAPLTQTILSGNAAVLLMPLVFAAWALRGRSALVGFAIAAAAAVKLTPVLLCLWLIWSGRWRALAFTIIAGLAILGISILGAGLGSFGAWWLTVPDQSPSPSSLAARLGISATLAAALVIAAAALMMVLLAILRRRGSMDQRSADGVAFAVTVVAATVATPALWFTATSFAVAALSPLVPLDRVRFAIRTTRDSLVRAHQR